MQTFQLVLLTFGLEASLSHMQVTCDAFLLRLHCVFAVDSPIVVYLCQVHTYVLLLCEEADFNSRQH